LVAAGAGAASLGFPRLGSSARGVRSADNLVLQWNGAFLEGVRNSKLGPPMVARALAIAHTCIYDAWAAYDNKAVGARLGSSLRRPARGRTAANEAKAISFAAYRAAVDLFPGSVSSVFDPLMRSRGYDTSDHSTDTSTPTGIGNVAAQAVLDFHHRDGANQLADEPGGVAGVPYSDHTGYAPANDPMDIRVPFDPATVHDPNAWQPLRYVDGSGTVVTPGFVGAQWQHVTTFAVSLGSLRSSTGPAKYGSPEYLAQAQALIDLSAARDHEHVLVDGATWFPYQPTTFPTPPFPEYLSGHSNFSAAGAEILKRFTHNDRFGASITLPAGSSRVEPGAVPSGDVTLSWSTFSDAADEAGISRRYGGIHFEQGDLDARTTGRIAARLVWERARDYWEGG
jgi:hypothetical protein